MKNFYGKYTKGSSFISSKSDNNFFSDRNINKVKKNILKNLKKMGIKKKDLFGKVIMNVGSGREALGLLQFNPKMIYHYDISSINIRDFNNEIGKKSLNKFIKTKQLDLSKDKLPIKKFDFIYLHGIIQHVSHVGLAIKNLSNSLKTNGRIWFYFYRPGSLSILLGSIQRFLLKNIKINEFYKNLKRSNNMHYIHSVMDDCYVPNRQLFYPNQYKKNLKKNNLEVYGNTYLTNSNKKVNFSKYHLSIVFFCKKKDSSKSKIRSSMFENLPPKKNINVMDSKYYQDNFIVKKILNSLNKQKYEDFSNIYDIVLKLHKIKNYINNQFLKKKFIKKNKVDEILDNVYELLTNKKNVIF